MVSEFQGQYRFLSNFWPAVVQLDRVSYPTVEHAYQAAKTDQPHWRKYIGSAPTPGLAKRRAKQLPLDCLSMTSEVERIMNHSEYNQLIEDAEKLEINKVHDFGRIHIGTGFRKNTAPSPRKSPVGQWYLDCVRCKRTLFSGKTGSAVSSPCVL